MCGEVAPSGRVYGNFWPGTLVVRGRGEVFEKLTQDREVRYVVFAGWSERMQGVG